MPGAAGRVVAEAALRVVGPDGHDVPAGGTGEAWTRGPALMSGLLGRSRADRGDPDADGWYRTGDLVEIDHARATCTSSGRLSDDHHPRRGQRVAGRGRSGARRAIPPCGRPPWSASPTPRYGEEVVAAVVLEPSADARRRRPVGALRRSLAGYKVPTRFVAVEQLPRNAHTGKVQRADVVALVGGGGQGGGAMTAVLRVAAVQFELRPEPDLEHFGGHVEAVVDAGGGGRSRAGRAARAGRHGAAGVGPRRSLAPGRPTCRRPTGASSRRVPSRSPTCCGRWPSPTGSRSSAAATTGGPATGPTATLRCSPIPMAGSNTRTSSTSRPRSRRWAPRPGRRCWSRGSGRPRRPSRSAPTSSSLRSAGTWLSAGSTSCCARRSPGIVAGPSASATASHARAMENQLFVVTAPLVGTCGVPTDGAIHGTGTALIAAPIDRTLGPRRRGGRRARGHPHRGHGGGRPGPRPDRRVTSPPRTARALQHAAGAVRAPGCRSHQCTDGAVGGRSA